MRGGSPWGVDGVDQFEPTGSTSCTDIPRFEEFQPEFAAFGMAQLVGHRLARELFENPRGVPRGGTILATYEGGRGGSSPSVRRIAYWLLLSRVRVRVSAEQLREAW